MSLSGIWTAKGIDKLAAQTAGGPVLTIDKIALGDGGGIVPAVLPSQTALLKEVWRGLVNAVLVEPDTPNAVTVEAVIPYSVGGFHIREWGIVDTDGDLIAVGPHAEFYKPLLAEGSGAELLERIQLPLANAGQVNLTISSEALATRKYVDQTATAKAQEEVTRHDADGEAHGGMAEELHNHVRDMNNPHQNPLPPLAQLKLPGLVCPDGCTSMVDAAGVLSALPGAQWRAVINYTQPVLVLGMDNKVYLWRAPSGPGLEGVGATQPGAAGSEVFWLDYAASILSKIPDGTPKGAVCPFYKVTFGGSDGRRPIFWGATTPDEGWVLADGGSDGAGGNVPNLRDRMIMGAGGSYAAGATGGAATHSHNVSGSAGGATLSVAQLASHSYRTNSSTGSVQNDGTALEYPENQNTGATGGSQAHSHSLSASAAAANGLPPFYALAICVKI